jgi:hypothetical protein
MNALRFALVIGALSLSVSAAHSSTVPDPKILVAGTGYSQPLYELSFTFAANSTGGGSFDFQNASGVDWGELDIMTSMPYGYVDGSWVPLDNPAYYEVASDLFASSALFFGANSLAIRLFGLDGEHHGIPYSPFFPPGKSEDGKSDAPPFGSHFLINLDNADTPGVGGWFDANHGPLSFDGVATPVPEPGTFALVLGGLLAIGLGSRRRR